MLVFTSKLLQICDFALIAELRQGCRDVGDNRIGDSNNSDEDNAHRYLDSEVRMNRYLTKSPSRGH